MEIFKIYETALNEYKAGNYEKALQILDELKKIVPNWAKVILLEAFICREKELYVSEIFLLEKFFSVVNIAEEPVAARDAYSLLAAVFSKVGRSIQAIDLFKISSRLENDLTEKEQELSNAIFAAANVENFSAADFENLYAEYRKNLAGIAPFEKIFYSHKKLRVGYLSADFEKHPVMFFAYNLITGHDKNLFDVYCYSAGETCDAVTENIKNSVTVWRDISNLSDEDAAKLIRTDEIDILFDLSGHSSGNRLPIMAYRPAAVQISGLGYMNSTGLNCVDYFLSDVHCAADSNYFTENIIAMNHSHFCYAPLKNFPAVNHVEKDFITFGCFNNFNKVTDSILKAWREILNAVPNSRLILKAKIFDNEECRNFVFERLKNFGIDISRIELRPFSADYLEQYNEIDIALDTFPYNGGVTTCEALIMGVPVISMRGDRHGNRMAYSILKNVGVEELAVSNLTEYIQRAIYLANDKDLLQVLHKNLRTMFQNSPLTDAKNYVREVEEIYLQVFQAAKES